MLVQLQLINGAAVAVVNAAEVGYISKTVSFVAAAVIYVGVVAVVSDAANPCLLQLPLSMMLSLQLSVLLKFQL